jgi:hypothetical protein
MTCSQCEGPMDIKEVVVCGKWEEWTVTVYWCRFCGWWDEGYAATW